MSRDAFECLVCGREWRAKPGPQTCPKGHLYVEWLSYEVRPQDVVLEREWRPKGELPPRFRGSLRVQCREEDAMSYTLGSLIDKALKVAKLENEDARWRCRELSLVVTKLEEASMWHGARDERERLKKSGLLNDPSL